MRQKPFGKPAATAAWDFATPRRRSSWKRLCPFCHCRQRCIRNIRRIQASRCTSTVAQRETIRHLMSVCEPRKLPRIREGRPHRSPRKIRIRRLRCAAGHALPAGQRPGSGRAELIDGLIFPGLNEAACEPPIFLYVKARRGRRTAKPGQIPACSIIRQSACDTLELCTFRSHSDLGGNTGSK